MLKLSRRTAIAVLAASLSLGVAKPGAAQAVKEIRLDWATYNPVSLVLKDQQILEKALEKEGVAVRWVQSAGSNKALEFLNAGSLDFGSTAGAAALIARINGNPIQSIYVYSRPEWTALVTNDNSPIKNVSDLKGKTIAVTRGTDPHIFLVRALAEAGLTEKDVKLVLLQHADGRMALQRGDVDAWAGLDPMMAAAEIENGARLFYRKPEANTWGILNVREEFAVQNPDLVTKVITAYETARAWAVANPAGVNKLLVEATKLPENVIARQLERTELNHSRIGSAQKDTILAAGQALQAAGVIDAKADVKTSVDALINEKFNPVIR